MGVIPRNENQGENQMKVNTKELLDILKVLRYGLSGNKETTDQSNAFAFRDGMAYTYNDEISVRTKFPIVDAFGAIESKKIYELMSKIKTDEVDLDFSENELKIKSDRIRSGISIEHEIHMPLDEITLPDDKQWFPLPDEFDKLLKSVVFSTSTDMQKIILTAIHCTSDKLESADGERATQQFLKQSYFKIKEPLLIPADAAKKLISIGNLSRYSQKDGWIHFETKQGSVISCRTIEGVFPNLDKLFDMTGSDLAFPEELSGVLDRAGVFVDSNYDQEKLITISISDRGIMSVRAENSNDWFEETVKVSTYKGNSVKFWINPQYLQQILKTTNQAVVGDNRVWFDSEKFRHVVALSSN